MKLSSVFTALLVSTALLVVPACKKDNKKADDKAGETAPAAEKPTDPPAATGDEAKAEPAAAAGDEAKAEPAAAGEPTEVKKDDPAGGEKKDEKGW